MNQYIRYTPFAQGMNILCYAPDGRLLDRGEQGPCRVAIFGRTRMVRKRRRY